MALHLIPFYVMDAKLASRETRTIDLLQAYRGVPPGMYALLEYYCPDPACDCRRVMLNVTEEQEPGRFLASISYAFDRDDPQAGPFLDPINKQSPYAPVLLDLVTTFILSDADYLARLERHYQLIKAAATDPRHPAYQELQHWLASEPNLEDSLGSLNRNRGQSMRAEPAAGRNAPCTCGSGKKYKQCCGRKRGGTSGYARMRNRPLS